MVGTSGNLSVREPDGSTWITASGRSKGELTENDFLRVRIDDGTVEERFRDEDRPSAETAIHRTVYELVPEAGACFHVHTVESNLVAAMTSGGGTLLPPLEMLKGLGLWEPHPSAVIAIFTNHYDVPNIAAEVRVRFVDDPPQVPGFLIRDHGVTVWGPTPEATRNHVELFDYVFRYMALARDKK